MKLLYAYTLFSLHLHTFTIDFMNFHESESSLFPESTTSIDENVSPHSGQTWPVELLDALSANDFCFFAIISSFPGIAIQRILFFKQKRCIASRFY